MLYDLISECRLEEKIHVCFLWKFYFIKWYFLASDFLWSQQTVLFRYPFCLTAVDSTGSGPLVTLTVAKMGVPRWWELNCLWLCHLEEYLSLMPVLISHKWCSLRSSQWQHIQVFEKGLVECLYVIVADPVRNCPSFPLFIRKIAKVWSFLSIDR